MQFADRSKHIYLDISILSTYYLLPMEYFDLPQNYPPPFYIKTITNFLKGSRAKTKIADSSSPNHCSCSTGGDNRYS